MTKSSILHMKLTKALLNQVLLGLNIAWMSSESVDGYRQRSLANSLKLVKSRNKMIEMTLILIFKMRSKSGPKLQMIT
jgi:hypothetical protein